METERKTLKAELLEARRLSDRLFDAVAPDAMSVRLIPARHRLIFYLGHLEAFDWNLIAADAGRSSGEPEFDALFARGIDPPPGKLPQDAAADWPALSAVRDYVARARARTDRVLTSASAELIGMAIEHRLMHIETLGYLLHQLDPAAKRPWQQPPAPATPPPEPRWITIAACRVRLGRAPGSGFGWDNEFGAQEEALPAFAIQQLKLSNRDWLGYLEQGGATPPFWRHHAGRWWLRTLFCEIELPLEWPVWVDQRAAAAYARDHDLALPSEAQWVAAAAHAAAPEPARDNYGLRRHDPVPVNAGLAPGCDTPHQMRGNGWEWTSTVFGPWPGFAPHPAYPGYSADFFDGEHFVLRGAGPLTHERLTRPGFRNWFRPDYPYLHAGVRCVATL